MRVRMTQSRACVNGLIQIATTNSCPIYTVHQLPAGAIYSGVKKQESRFRLTPQSGRGRYSARRGRGLGFSTLRAGDLLGLRCANTFRETRQTLTRRNLGSTAQLIEHSGTSIERLCDDLKSAQGHLFIIAEIDWIRELRESEDLSSAQKAACPTWPQYSEWRKQCWREKQASAKPGTADRWRLCVFHWTHSLLFETNTGPKSFSGQPQGCQHLDADSLELVHLAALNGERGEGPVCEKCLCENVGVKMLV